MLVPLRDKIVDERRAEFLALHKSDPVVFAAWISALEERSELFEGLCWSRETCICETLSRFAISVWLTLS